LLESIDWEALEIPDSWNEETIELFKQTLSDGIRKGYYGIDEQGLIQSGYGPFEPDEQSNFTSRAGNPQYADQFFSNYQHNQDIPGLTVNNYAYAGIMSARLKNDFRSINWHFADVERDVNGIRAAWSGRALAIENNFQGQISKIRNDLASSTNGWNARSTAIENNFQGQMNKFRTDLALSTNGWNARSTAIENNFQGQMNKFRGDLSLSTDGWNKRSSAIEKNFQTQITNDRNDLKLSTEGWNKRTASIEKNFQTQITNDRNDLKLSTEGWNKRSEAIEKNFQSQTNSIKDDLALSTLGWNNRSNSIEKNFQSQTNEIRENLKLSTQGWNDRSNAIEKNFQEQINNIKIPDNTDILNKIKSAIDFSNIELATIVINTNDTKNNTADIVSNTKDINDTLLNAFSSDMQGDDGFFTSMLKNQFGLMRELYSTKADAIINTFEIGSDDLTNHDGDSLFTSMLKKGLYGIRYSLVQGFDDLDTWFSAITINQDTTIGYQKMIHEIISSQLETLNIITQWLKTIYEKPTANIGSVVVTPFDYDRLEKMLESLKFGNIVNEAGTNIWDVLQALIDGILDLSGEIIKATASIIETLGDLLLELIDKIIELIVPKDTEFLDKNFEKINASFKVKFSGFLGIADTVQDIFKPTESNFFDMVSFELFGAKFDGNEAKPMMDKVVPKFRTLIQLSIWLMVAMFIYRKVTGTGDLINDN